MINVLHVVNTKSLSGAEKVVLLLAKNMKDVKPFVACGGEPLNSVYKENGIESFTIDYTKGFVNTIKALKKVILDNDIKIAHAHDNTASIYCLAVKNILGVKDLKIISHIHSCYPWLNGNSKFKAIDKFVRNKYDLNIACGDLVYSFYKENSPYLDLEKMVSIPNGIDVDKIQETTYNVDSLKEKFNIPKDKIVYGYIGRLIELKGIIEVIDALSKKKDNFKDSVFLLVGSGDKEEEIKELIHKYNMEDMFVLTGYHDNVYEIYPVIDIFFLPSKYEGLPMVILEAMAFGKAIVSTDVGSIPELLKNNNGILVEQGDYDKFVSKLLYLKENKEDLKTLSSNAKKFIKDKYDVKNQSSNIEEIYKKIER